MCVVPTWQFFVHLTILDSNPNWKKYDEEYREQMTKLEIESSRKNRGPIKNRTASSVSFWDYAQNCSTLHKIISWYVCAFHFSEDNFFSVIIAWIIVARVETRDAVALIIKCSISSKSFTWSTASGYEVMVKVSLRSNCKKRESWIHTKEMKKKQFGFLVFITWSFVLLYSKKWHESSCFPKGNL